MWYNTSTSKGVYFFAYSRSPDLEGGNQDNQKLSKVKEAPKIMRVKITLACQECKQRNYNTKKNKKNNPDRLEMNKHCRFCRKHTLHKETK